MFMIVPIWKNNTESRMLLNVNSIVAMTTGLTGLCVLLSTSEEICASLTTIEFLSILEKTTGKPVVSL